MAGLRGPRVKQTLSRCSLRLALEPEAASFCVLRNMGETKDSPNLRPGYAALFFVVFSSCGGFVAGVFSDMREFDQKPFEMTQTWFFTHFFVSDSYVIVDCGGGTVDITCHTISQTDSESSKQTLSLMEFDWPHGGEWGGDNIEENGTTSTCTFHKAVLNIFYGC